MEEMSEWEIVPVSIGSFSRMMNTGAVSYEFRLSLDREISTAAVFIRKIRKLSHMSCDIESNATHSLIPKRQI
ncbi:hypothetical protein T01_9471 [Trichinella spiralis]|uniref:Uncharacterized protein n=1 Tax=Trichinella spiralis TaxID=6334 RepID=A0A0V1AY66_TRISP|nr:hypothetical protein T01_9471 [Trichinella spiralis]